MDDNSEAAAGGDPVEGSCKVVSTKNDGGAWIEPPCSGFSEQPGFAEAHLSTKLLMDMGGPFRRHLRHSGTPIPPRRKSATSSSQPV